MEVIQSEHLPCHWYQFSWSVPRAKSHLVISTLSPLVYLHHPPLGLHSYINQSQPHRLCPMGPSQLLLSWAQNHSWIEPPQPQDSGTFQDHVVIIWWLHNMHPQATSLAGLGPEGLNPLSLQSISIYCRLFFFDWSAVVCAYLLSFPICMLIVWPLCPVCIPISITPMWTVTIVTDTSGLQTPIAYVFCDLWQPSL